MRVPRVRVRLGQLMIAVAIVACVLGADAAFSIKPNTKWNQLEGWAALYGIPPLVMVARRVSPRSAARVSGKILLFGLPAACLYGLLCYAVGGHVGLIGGSALAVLQLGWAALGAAAFLADRAAIPEP